MGGSLLLAGLLGLSLAVFACGGAEGDGERSEPPSKTSEQEPSPPSVGRIAPLRVFRGEWTHDFGEIEANEKGVHVCSVGWGGDEDLVTSALRPSCGCLTATLLAEDAEGRVAPHAMGEPLRPRSLFGVRVVLDTKGMGGPVEKAVRVLSEDGDALRLVLRASVRRKR